MSSGRRRSGNATAGTSTEDQALNQIASEAESRLAAKRAARAEARSIRMKELEKQQRELDEECERQYQNDETPLKKKSSQTPSAGSIENSTDDVDGLFDADKTIKQLQDKVNELEDKYRKAMVQIAQLDDEKQALVYQAEDLKDKLEDGEDACTEARYELKEKNKEIDRLKRENKTLQNEIQQYKEAIEYRDNFIAEKGLSLFEEAEQEENSTSECDGGNTSSLNEESAASTPAVDDKTNSDSGDTAGRRASVSDDKEVLVNQIKVLQSQVADMKTVGADRRHLEVPTQDELEDIRREFARQVNDMKIKVHKMEQENTRLEGLVMRLESQVKRYKSQAEAAESTEEGLKAEKRKLQRELRKAQDEIIEIQTAHDHIQKRYEKLKSRRKEET